MSDRESIDRGALLFMIYVLVVVLLCWAAGCHRAPGTATRLPVVEVRIAPRQPVMCFVPALADVPDPPAYQSASEQPDIMMRTMVHRRTYDELIRYMHEEHVVIEAQGNCIERLREQLAEDTGSVVK